MRTLRAYLLVLTAIACAGAFAQQYNSLQEYQNWKNSLIQDGGHVEMNTHTEVAHDRPSVVHELRGGGQTTCDCWVEPDPSYTTINNNSQWNASGFNSADDGSYGPINLPFQFYLYGQYWNTAYININGNVSFGQYFGAFSSTGFPVASYTMVAPFWADVDLNGSCAGCNVVQYKITPTALYVNWTNVGYFSSQTNMLNTFQLIITDGTDPVIANGANVSFCYKDMQWTTGSASGGVNGFGGTPASVGANQGNGIDYIQFGRFDHAGNDYDGPYGAVDGVSFLDDQYFSFSTAITTANVPPVVSGQSVCDTIILCAGQTQQINMSFLSPEPSQTTVPTATCPTLSSFNIVSATSGVNATIAVEFTPTPADVGYHTITFEGTDDGNPVMTSTVNSVIWVQIAANMEPGDTTVCSNAASFAMFDLLGGTTALGGTWTDPDGQPHSGTFQPGTDTPGEYTYAIGLGGSCESIGTVTVNVVTAANAGSDGAVSYCTTDAADDLFVHLNGTPDSGGEWKDPNGTIVSGTIDPGSWPAGDYTYKVYGSNPCPDVQAVVAVTIQQAMDPGANAQIALCTDAAALTMVDALNGTPSAGGTWTAPNGGAFSGTFHAATDATGTYTYTVTPVAPCPVLSSQLVVSVDPLPDAGVDGDVELCANAGTSPLFSQLTGGPDTGGEWLDPLGAAHSGVLDPALEVSGDYIYVVHGPGTCHHLTDSSLVSVQVNPMPVVSFTAEPDSGCAPLTVTLKNTTESIYVGNSCVWDPGDETGDLQECDQFEHVYEEAGWFNVRLTVTSPFGCTDHLIKQGFVLVEPAPKADMSWSPEVGTELSHEIVFTAGDPHSVEFAWTLQGEPVSDQRQFLHDFPNVLGDKYDICLAVQDRYGCADTACKVVDVVVPSLFIPNTFTPNNDGWNEVFLPIGSDMIEEDHEFMIFDRWGQLVFDSVDPTEGWNGSRNNTGDQLPEGVYTWRLVERPFGTSDKKDWFGTVMLLR